MVANQNLNLGIHILRRALKRRFFGIFYGQLEYLRPFGIHKYVEVIWYAFPILVYCTKKNLATLHRILSWTVTCSSSAARVLNVGLSAGARLQQRFMTPCTDEGQYCGFGRRWPARRCARKCGPLSIPESKRGLFIGGTQGCQIFQQQHTKTGESKPDGHKIYRMAIKYTKWPLNATTSAIIVRPSKIFPNLDLLFQKIPTDNPGGTLQSRYEWLLLNCFDIVQVPAVFVGVVVVCNMIFFTNSRCA
jgi:hypothetical protein